MFTCFQKYRCYYFDNSWTEQNFFFFNRLFVYLRIKVYLSVVYNYNYFFFFDAEQNIF